MERDLLLAVVQLVMGAFFALNGAILWVIWREVKSLRESRHQHAQDLLTHGLQIKELAKDVEEIFSRLEARTA